VRSGERGGEKYYPNSAGRKPKPRVLKCRLERTDTKQYQLCARSTTEAFCKHSCWLGCFVLKGIVAVWEGYAKIHMKTVEDVNFATLPGFQEAEQPVINRVY
jgi:hypothetical protein